MAIIKCPECENEISDKAKKCIHCGKVFEEHVIKEENVFRLQNKERVCRSV